MLRRGAQYLQGPGRAACVELKSSTFGVTNTPGGSACSPKCTEAPVSRHCPGCIQAVSQGCPSTVQGCPKGIPGLSRLYLSCIQAVSWGCPGCIPGMSRVYPGSIPWASRVHPGCIQAVSQGCPRSILGVSWRYPDDVPGVSRDVPALSRSRFHGATWCRRGKGRPRRGGLSRVN